MENYDIWIDQAIDQYLETLVQSRLKSAIRYALSGTGKRLRPKLMLATIEARGFNAKDYASVALALELVHTYSLVHDDLPAMDDDALRRGQPTTHIQFDEATAILVGDALLSDAFRLISEAAQISPDKQSAIIRILAEKIGSKGMVYGQILDIASENTSGDVAQLMAINTHKTAHLLEAALMMGAIASNESNLERTEQLGRDLGLLYQIQDDLLEATSDEATAGKSFSDDRRKKPTYLTVLGLEKTQAMNDQYYASIQASLKALELEHTVLDELIQTIIHRTY